MKVLLLNSGGKDSLATAMLLRRTRGYNIHSLHVDFGHENAAKAKVAANKIANAYCDTHVVIKIDGKLLMVNPDGYKHVAHQGSLLHVLGASYAIAQGIYAIASGQGPGGMEVGFDEKMKLFLGTSRLTSAIPVYLCPLMAGIDTYDIVKDEPLWRETVTCNREPPCGICNKCLLRANWEAR